TVRGIERHAAAAWLCLGALLWTRPDGFVIAVSLAVAALAFPTAPRRSIAIALLRAGVVAAVVYLPWLLWASWYYGSPVPHTIIAKSEVAAGRLTQLKIIVKETPDRF